MYLDYNDTFHYLNQKYYLYKKIIRLLPTKITLISKFFIRHIMRNMILINMLNVFIILFEKTDKIRILSYSLSR